MSGDNRSSEKGEKRALRDYWSDTSGRDDILYKVVGFNPGPTNLWFVGADSAMGDDGNEHYVLYWQRMIGGIKEGLKIVHDREKADKRAYERAKEFALTRTCTRERKFMPPETEADFVDETRRGKAKAGKLETATT